MQSILLGTNYRKLVSITKFTITNLDKYSPTTSLLINEMDSTKCSVISKY
jgi:hypothetical protein